VEDRAASAVVEAADGAEEPVVAVDGAAEDMEAARVEDRSSSDTM
jgi:hypothetical protein